MIPFFSVVIPLYNKEQYIKNTLQSVLNQVFQDFEIIIVNDGSTDRSIDIVYALNDKRIQVFTQENKGVALARNFGIKKSKSKFIALIDADDTWRINHLSEIKKSIDFFPEAKLFCNNYEIQYNSKIICKPNINLDYKNDPVVIKDYFKASYGDNLVWTSATAFCKETFLQLNGFNPVYLTGQDLDLWIRFALSHDIVFNPNITMCYNKGIKNSLSKSDYELIRYKLFSSFRSEETKNKTLKKYLDIMRYGIALRCKTQNKLNIYKKTINDINFKNLNNKQKFLLSLPYPILLILNKLRNIALKNNLYLTLFK